MKYIVIAFLFAPSMLLAKAESPVNISAPIEMAALNLNADSSDVPPKPSEADIKAWAEQLAGQMEKHINELIMQLSLATDAYNSMKLDWAKAREASIRDLKSTVQIFWTGGSRPDAGQVALLSQAVEKFRTAQNCAIERRRSSAQQSPKISPSE